MKNATKWLAYLGIAVLLVSVWWMVYTAGKTLQYKWVYEDRVRDTVKSMVKQEALR